MFLQPHGQALTTSQTVALDDEFFGSRPLAYTSARIAALLAAAEAPAAAQSDRLAACIAGIGAGHGPDTAVFTDTDRDQYVAAEAFGMRHHGAETLVRLYHALAVARRPAGAPWCVWSALCDGPVQTADIVGQSRAHLASDAGHTTFWELVLPPETALNSPPQETDTIALNVMAAWLDRAMQLLDTEFIDLNAANNKIKHGVAVRPHIDLLAMFTTTGPGPDSTMPVSALTGIHSHELIGGVSLAHLARPRAAGRKQGLEMTVLNLRPEMLLAESWMFARTHAAMFHVAARQHFFGRDDTRRALMPAQLVGPTPDELLGDEIVGVRHPVTTPPGGGAPDREPVIASRKSAVPFSIDFGQARTVTLVDG